MTDDWRAQLTKEERAALERLYCSDVSMLAKALAEARANAKRWEEESQQRTVLAHRVADLELEMSEKEAKLAAMKSYVKHSHHCQADRMYAEDERHDLLKLDEGFCRCGLLELLEGGSE